MNELEEVTSWLRAEYAYMTGVALPPKICNRCLQELFSFYSALESLEEILALGLHPCEHTLTAVTVLNGMINGHAELVEQLAEEIDMHGWNHGPACLTDDEHDLPTVH